jgi:hypothetical protein
MRHPPVIWWNNLEPVLFRYSLSGQLLEANRFPMLSLKKPGGSQTPSQRGQDHSGRMS